MNVAEFYALTEVADPFPENIIVFQDTETGKVFTIKEIIREDNEMGATVFIRGEEY